MKKFFPVALLLFCVVFNSCKSKDKAPSGPDYAIKMRLAKGDSFRHHLDARVNTAFEMANNKMGMEMGMLFTVKFDVLGDSAGYHLVRLTYEEAKMSMDFKGLPTDAPDTDEIFDKVSRETEGKSIVLLLNNKYQIEDVIGFDELTGDSDMPGYEEQYEKMFSKDQINSMMGIMFNVYPDKPVKVGETWENVTETGMSNLKMKMNNKYELIEVKDSVATIELVSDYKGKGEMSQSGMKLYMEMDGEQTGTIKIDLTTGYLQRADNNLDVDAKANIMGQKVPYKVTGKTVIQAK